MYDNPLSYIGAYLRYPRYSQCFLPLSSLPRIPEVPMSSKIVVSVALSQQELAQLATAQLTPNGILPKSVVLKQAFAEYCAKRGI